MRIKLIAVVFLVLTFGNTIAQRNGKPVVIKGIIEDKAAFTKVYLDTINGKNPWIYSSSPIADDGTFEITAAVPETDIYRLRLDDRNFLMLILSPGEKINMKIKGSKLGMDTKVDGSEHTRLLVNVMNNFQSFDKKRDSLNAEYSRVQSLPEKEMLTQQIINAFRSNDSLQKSYLKAQIQKTPASLAWLFFQDKLDITNDFDAIEKMDEAMLKEYPKNALVQSFHQTVDLERKTAIGHPAPDIALPGTDGTVRKLSSLKGKVVLVDFWASWCGPCRRENPNVVRIYNEYRDKGFEVFSVSLDKDKDSWLRAITKDGLVWQNHVSDLKYWNSEGARIYGVSAIPYTVLLDKKGRIVAKKLRGEELEKKVAELLQ